MTLRGAANAEDAMAGDNHGEGAVGLTTTGIFVSIGGNTRGGGIDEADLYDTNADGSSYRKWDIQSSASYGVARLAAGAPGDDGYLYHGGGYGPAAGYEVISDYDPATDTYANVTSSTTFPRVEYGDISGESAAKTIERQRRSGLCATSGPADGESGTWTIFFVGGRRNANTNQSTGPWPDQAVTYVPSTGTVTAVDYGFHPNNGAVAMFEGDLWICGGVEPTGSPTDSSWTAGSLVTRTRVVDLSAASASDGPSMPVALQGHSLVVINQRLFIMGGQTHATTFGSGASAKVWMLNEDKDGWIRMADLPGTCNFGGAAPNSDKHTGFPQDTGYIIRGRTSTGGTTYSSPTLYEMKWVHGELGVLTAADHTQA